MATFSIWECDGEITLKRGSDRPAGGAAGATPVKVFEAAGWNEACRAQYDHYGWGAYEAQDWQGTDPDGATPP